VVLSRYLEPSSKKFNIPLEVYLKSNIGDWNSNTRIKSNIILQAMEQYNDDICIIDADATIEQQPSLLFEIPPQYDIAAYLFDWWKHWRGVEGKKEFHLCTGTLMMRNNNRVRSLLHEWITANSIAPKNVWEQRVLQDLLTSKRNDIKIYELPASYCAIVDQSGKLPAYIQNPVIIHHQVSREIRRNPGLLK